MSDAAATGSAGGSPAGGADGKSTAWIGVEPSLDVIGEPVATYADR